MQNPFTETVIEFEINGSRKTLAYRRLPVSAWRELKTAAGFTPLSFLRALNEWDVDAILGLVWLERKQREPNLSHADAVADTEQRFDADGLNFKMVDLRQDGQADDDPPTTGS